MKYHVGQYVRLSNDQGLDLPDFALGQVGQIQAASNAAHEDGIYAVVVVTKGKLVLVNEVTWYQIDGIVA